MIDMSTLDKFVNEARKVFAEYERPVQCIDHQDDPEYKEHEESLTNVTCSNLSITHIGHAGWHPLHALGSEAFAHFLPKMIEFAVTGAKDRNGEPFMFLFIAVVGDAIKEPKCDLLGSVQREFIFRTFLLLKALYLPIFRDCEYEEDLNDAIEYWET